MELLLLLTISLFSSPATTAPSLNQKFPFPALDPSIIPFDSSTPFFKFDGIDYDELPGEFKKAYYTCYADHVNCIRNRNQFNSVCAYLTWAGWSSYYSYCQLEYKNCEFRLKHRQGLYGTYYSNDDALYQGERYDCYKSDKSKDSRRLGPVYDYRKLF